LLRRDVLVRNTRGQHACDPRRRDHADDRDRPEHQEGDAEEPPGKPLRLGLVTTVEMGHEGRDENGRERPRGEELEQHVGDRVRRLIGVAEVRRPEHGCDHEDA
jgi:hypothetical protein